MKKFTLLIISHSCEATVPYFQVSEGKYAKYAKVIRENLSQI